MTGRRYKARGFSLMELLVVIAIIAVLAGLIFPIASTMRERGNESACIGNLQSIGQALKLYRLDEREYPPALYGWLEEGAAKPTTFLYPHYARSRQEFKCPSNRFRDDETLLAGPFNANALPAAVPMKHVARTGGGYDLKPVWEPRPTKTIAYYAFDSYDGGVLMPRANAAGSPAMGEFGGAKVIPLYAGGDASMTAQYQQHYRRDWADMTGKTAALGARQLLNRNPEDSTYVTACTYHRRYAGNEVAKAHNSLDMVLFLDGHTEKVPSSEMIDLAAGNGYNWAATPKFLMGQ